MAPFREHVFHSIEQAQAAMIEAIADALCLCIAKRGHAVLAVGGGRTPLAVLPRLAASGCDWSRVTVTLTDERCVGADDPASNEGLVRRALLQGPAAQAKFVGLADIAAPPPQPDVIYLGFGEDGHVASLFPGGSELAATHLGLVAATAPVAPRARLSLTLPTLLAASRIVILVAGAEKCVVYTRAKAESDTDAPSLPLSHVLRGAGAKVEVFLA